MYNEAYDHDIGVAFIIHYKYSYALASGEA